MIGTMTSMGSGMTLQSIGTNRMPATQEGPRAFSTGVPSGQTLSSAEARPAPKAAGEPKGLEGNRPPPPPSSESAREMSVQSNDQMTPPNSAALFQSLIGDAAGMQGDGSFSLSADSDMVEKLYARIQTAQEG